MSDLWKGWQFSRQVQRRLYVSSFEAKYYRANDSCTSWFRNVNNLYQMRVNKPKRKKSKLKIPQGQKNMYYIVATALSLKLSPLHSLLWGRCQWKLQLFFFHLWKYIKYRGIFRIIWSNINESSFFINENRREGSNA